MMTCFFFTSQNWDTPSHEHVLSKSCQCFIHLWEKFKSDINVVIIEMVFKQTSTNCRSFNIKYVTVSLSDRIAMAHLEIHFYLWQRHSIVLEPYINTLPLTPPLCFKCSATRCSHKWPSSGSALCALQYIFM